MSGASRVRAVALDVDGTVASDDHSVTPRTLRALRGVQDSGIAVILLTGRVRSSALGIAYQAALRSPVISCNGAVTTDPVSGKDIRVATLPQAEVLQMRDLAEKFGLAFTWWTSNAMYVAAEGPISALLADLNQMAAVVGDPSRIEAGSVVKGMYFGESAILDLHSSEIVAHFPRIARGMSEFFELSPPLASKWESLESVLDGLGIAPEECLGIGDASNDVPWLRRIGYPVAMGNARSEVKAVADLTIGHHADEGVADYLESRFHLADS